MKLIGLLLFPSFLLFAQSPNIEWQNRIGGFNIDLNGNSQHTVDGGYIIGGYSNSNISGDKTENSKGLFDYWIVKTNNLGTVEWDKTIGGSAPNGWEQDIFTVIKQTLDGGYIVCGYSDSPISSDKTENPIGSADFWVVKLNSTGTIEWQNTIGGTDADEPYSIIQTLDGGFLVSGQSQSNISGDKTQNSRGLQDYWIVKLNNLGIVEWDKTIGGSGNDILSSTLQLDNGNYLLAGFSNSNISGDKTENSKGVHDFWVLQLDLSGNILWQKTIGGSGFDIPICLTKTSISTFLLGGRSNSNISGDKTENCRGLYDFWVLEIDTLGNILWQKTIGGNQEDSLLSVIHCSDNNFLLSGSSRSGISGDKTDPLYGIGGTDAWIVKLSSLGNILWQKTIGGTGDDGFNSVIQVSDGSYFLSGGTNSPISGDITELPVGINDYWIIKLEPDNLSNLESELLNQVTVYPNPTHNNVTINYNSSLEKASISIYNILGQLISKTNLNQIFENKVPIEGQNGVYFIEIETENHQKKVFKIVKN